MELEGVAEEVECLEDGEAKADVSERWNQEVVSEYKRYLLSGEYPANLPKEKRRNFRKRAKDFEVKDGELYYIKSGTLRLALSCSEQWLRAFQECHTNPSGGHMGRTKTVDKLKMRYYWPNQYIYVVTQIKHCDRCQRIQPVLKSQSSELHPISVSPQVWNLVGMDLIGPLKLTSRGNQYLLTMTCYFSKWVEAFPIKEKSALCVAHAIYTAYCRHGAPNEIITDQGREFVNQMSETLHSKFKVKQKITSAYHPQSNGLDERTNQTIKRCLVKMIGEHDNEWDDYVDPILFGIRTSTQESTKYSPFFLMHGREARFPLEAEKSLSTPFPDPSAAIQERVDALSKLKENVFPIAKANINNSQKKQKQQYQKRKGIVKTNINVNDVVLRLNMVKHTKKGHKMEDTWLGPYKVLKISDKGSCLLQSIKTQKEIKQKVNVSQLKLYADPSQLDESASIENGQTKTAGTEKTAATDKTESVSLDPHLLKDQLFNDAVMRLWRTGAGSELWNPMEDDQTSLALEISDEEHGLSIDTDVALWLDYRSFCNSPLLKKIDNFVIVTNKLHDEFDAFKKTELSKIDGFNLLPLIGLLKFWYMFQNNPLSIVSYYGKDYVSLSQSQTDELCTWADEMRIKYMSEGQAIFEIKNNVTDFEDENTTNDKWVPFLDLYYCDRVIIEAGEMLHDKHMYAAHKILKKQFPDYDGFQPTILCQNNGFSEVSKNAIQIHYTGHAHWVTSAFVGGEVRLYDSSISTSLPSSLKTQLKALYRCAAKSGVLLIVQMPVQQQSNLSDCGVFSIAFAYHLALGDEPAALTFDEKAFRPHLIQCLKKEEFEPFPLKYGKSSCHCAKKYRQIKC